MIITIKIIIAVGIALLEDIFKNSTWFIKQSERLPQSARKVIFKVPIAIVAISIVVAAMLIDLTEENFSKPKLDIRTKKVSEFTLELNIINGDRPLENLIVEMPFYGVITGISETTSPTARENVVKAVTGSVLSNGAYGGGTQAEFSIRSISPNQMLSFQINYKPIKMAGGITIEVVGYDRYSYNYSWLFKGNRISSGPHWKLLLDDSATEAPFGRVTQLVVSPNGIGDAPVEKKVIFP
jgi:hypothetical protein